MFHITVAWIQKLSGVVQAKNNYLGTYILYIFYILKHKNCMYDCSYTHFKN